MRTSKMGLAQIVAREGVRLRAYRDSVGISTIGVGHTGPDVHMGRRISLATAYRLLAQDVASVEFRLSEFEIPAQGMFDALVSFGFNLGVGIFGTEHTIGQFLHAKRWDKVGDAMLLYDVAGGRVMLGLLNRRKSERRQYNQGLRAWRRRNRAS